ncbi:putative plastid-lipid-associated chloroplastic isoform A [Chlorella sorokiniana]|uniref:Plastid-lipid-associated chloroplastic isoform A n=1 Tax=Chlorella sorokiniana TaxID=3076 RepID=A0A2P6TZ06_CHLSO|nr:putative plastid-lipid-associated chloroplastic isoform A [Chlorella sorokiniana]|eukprot:PRW59283.1 putative plastid-lipid-associated chloroplastic isoform A [Chlorella sorokiniana]
MQSAAAVRGQPLRVAQPRRASAARRGAVQTQALFSFLAPPKAKAGPGKAQELVDQLLELSSRTDGGLNASPAKRQQIEELVDELEAFCPRNPLRSPLLYGDYEVTYTSKPQAAGGPYRSLPGRIVFPGQRPTQSIQPPNVLVNEVAYKTLGFLPGSVRQEGEITPINSDTFELVFNKGGKRIIQIVYLDDRVRVARSIPDEDAGTEGAIFVFRRLVEEEEVEEEVEELVEEAPKRGAFAFGTRKMKAAAAEEEEEEEEARPARRPFGTQLLGRKEGLATMAERRYAEQQGSRGTGSRGTQGRGARGGSAPAPTGTARKSREEIAAERAAAKAAAEEERRAAREAAEAEKARAREEAARAKAAAEEERRRAREQQEAERARQAELKEKAKEQLAALTAEAAEAIDEAKEAAAAAKEAEKAASSLLQQAGQARGLIDQAAAAFAAAVQQVEELKAAEKEAAAEAGEARGLLKQLETAARRR